ncbi:outer membrane beta-barrel family protein [Niastella populi]|uniref:outer membrane beta-barrel family protein n=1 Tax=Niastella populi TaxID=550983 RepID=UPI0013FD491F|nr:outer membrane beta-barrel family protein [Niastella populi]
MRYIILPVILLFCVLPVFAQNKYKLAGTVVDSLNKPVETGDAFLLKTADSVQVQATLVQHGTFQFDNIESGTYLLKLSSSGFLVNFSTVTVNSTMKVNIVLTVRVKALQEVEVTGSKPVITTKDGNMKMEVDNTIMATIPNPLDLIAKLPGIQLSGDRQSVVSIEARSEPLIYLDNQRITLNELNALSVRDIKSIDLISNPSAKYEASGRVVIAITRKQNKFDGYKIDLSEAASFKRRYNNYAGINASVKKNKIEVKGNFNYNRMNPWESNRSLFSIEDQKYKTEYTVLSISKAPQLLYGGGLFYQINKDDYFSVNANGFYRQDKFPIRNNSYLQEDVVIDKVLTTTTNDRSRRFISTIGNYSKKLKKSSQLFLGAQYSRFSEDLTTDVSNNYNNTGDVPTQDRFQKAKIEVLAGKADYDRKLNNDLKWESGVNVYQAWSDVFMDIEEYNPPVASQTNYKYTEKNYAGYTNISGKIKTYNFSAGLRLEHTNVDGGFKNNSGPVVKRDQTFLFPKASFVIPIDSTKSLTLAYTRTITRPNFTNLSQITIYLNPRTAFSRNINLLPTINDEVSARYQYKGNFLRVVYYRQTNPVYFGTEYDQQTNIVTIKDRNYAREEGVTAILTIPAKYRFWNSINTVIGNFSKVKDSNAILNSPKPNLYLYTNNQFRLGKNFTFVLNGWYLTKRFTGLYERNELSAVDAGLIKTIKKFTFSAMWNDMFRTLSSNQKFIINNIRSDQTYYEDVREFVITVKFSFGDIKKSAYKNVNVDETMDRVK